MTAIDQILQEIKERADRGTPGPWGVERTEDTDWIGPMRRDNSRKIKQIVTHIDTSGYTDESTAIRNDNADFIASAKSDVPRLVEAVRVLAEGLEHYQKWNHLGPERANQALQRATEILKA